MVKLITVQSDSESNILVAFSSEVWGFKEEMKRTNIRLGTFITFYCTETSDLKGLGLILNEAKNGKIQRNIWLDGDYYNETPFSLISKKQISKDRLQQLFGSNWYKKLNPFCSAHGACATFSAEELQKLIDEFMTA